MNAEKQKEIGETKMQKKIKWATIGLTRSQKSFRADACSAPRKKPDAVREVTVKGLLRAGFANAESAARWATESGYQLFCGPHGAWCGYRGSDPDVKNL